MPKTKTFKNYYSFRKAIANQLPKHQHWLISGELVALGYAIKEVIENPYTVKYSLKPGVNLTVEDVEKVVKALGR